MPEYKCSQCEEPINSGYVMVAYHYGRRLLLHDSGDNPPAVSCTEMFAVQNRTAVNGTTTPFPQLEEVLKKMPEPARTR